MGIIWIEELNLYHLPQRERNTLGVLLAIRMQSGGPLILCTFKILSNGVPKSPPTDEIKTYKFLLARISCRPKSKREDLISIRMSHQHHFDKIFCFILKSYQV